MLKTFLKDYFKRYGVLAAGLSVAALMVFYCSVVPASAALPGGTYEYSQSYSGGIQVESAITKVAYDTTAPRNAAGEKLIYVGNFKVTHYCACAICCGKSNGITASGLHVADGMIAADWKVLPKGTKVYIKKGDQLLEKVVEDTGGAIKGNKIDVYVPTHQGALAAGVYYADLYVDPGTVLPGKTQP